MSILVSSPIFDSPSSSSSSSSSSRIEIESKIKKSPKIKRSPSDENLKVVVLADDDPDYCPKDDNDEEENEEKEEEEEEKIANRNKKANFLRQNDKLYHCAYTGCTRRFDRPSRLRTHIDMNHTFILRYDCPEENCAESFACQSYLTRHLKRHQKVSGDPQDPSISERKDVSKIDKDGSGKARKRSFSCEQCSENFLRKIELRIHRAAKHGEPLPYKCSVCGKMFPVRYKLSRHAKCHQSKTYRCDHPNCDFVIDKWSLLRRHLSTVHSKLDCAHCGRRFKRSESLHLHLDTIHSSSSSSSDPNSAKRFVCEHLDCTKAYTRERSLRTHLRNSHGEPKFCCDHCGARFRHKKSLHNHMDRCVKKRKKKETKKEEEEKKTSKRKKVKLSLESEIRSTLRHDMRGIKPPICEDNFDLHDKLAFAQVDRVLSLQQQQVKKEKAEEEEEEESMTDQYANGCLDADRNGGDNGISLQLLAQSNLL